MAMNPESLKNLKRGGTKRGPNKVTATAKAMIEAVAASLGGAERMAAWAQEAPENERVFWGTIFPRLLPLQVNGPGEEGEHLVKVSADEAFARIASRLAGIAPGTAGSPDGTE